MIFVIFISRLFCSFSLLLAYYGFPSKRQFLLVFFFEIKYHQFNVFNE